MEPVLQWPGEKHSWQKEQQGGGLEAGVNHKAGGLIKSVWLEPCEQGEMIVRWGWNEEQQPSHVGPLKAVMKSLHFILNAVMK